MQSNNAFYNGLFLSPDVLSNALRDINGIQFQNPEYFSDHFIQDGSFARIDHITASYHFNELFNGKSNITVSATLQNPLLITNYSGIDPEIFGGIDNNFYPRTRTFLLGVNASF